jgi:hypothetical protein
VSQSGGPTSACSSTSRTARSTPTHTVTPDERAFFYVDGIPTKGIWLDLDSIDCWADVRDALHRAGVADADYGGDVLVADIEGPLARACYSSRFDLLDLGAFLELRSDVERNGFSSAAVVAFMDWQGSWDSEAFESAYMGFYNSEEAFADQYIDDTGMLSDVPEHLRWYFDIERFSRDLFCGDYWFDEGGYVFCCNC